MISGFRRDIDEICALVRVGPISKGQEVHEDSLTLEEGTDMSQNVAKGVPFDAT
jgi:hypothetical protein